MEIIEGDFVAGEPVFGEESEAFGETHAFDRADATFNVSPIVLLLKVGHVLLVS